MRQRSADIGLSDVFLSLRFLSPESETTRKAIVNALGFEWEAPGISSEQKDPNAEGFSSPSVPAPQVEVSEQSQISAPDNITILHPQQETDVDSIDIFAGVEWENLDMLAETKIDEHFKKPRYVSLLKENWFRGIMSLILSTSMPTPKIDLKLLEKSITRLLPIEHVPYRLHQTLELGVQILLDVSESMQPFWRDEANLIVSLSHLLDEHKTRVFEFELEMFSERRIVWQVGSSELLQWKVPILIVTNFGFGGEQRVSKIRDCEPLRALLERAKNKKCPVAALVPLPEQNFPSDLKKFIPFSFVWDHGTSPQIVSRILRH